MEIAAKERSDFSLSRCLVIKLSLIELEMFGARILTFNSFHLKRFRSVCIPLFQFDLFGGVWQMSYGRKKEEFRRE